MPIQKSFGYIYGVIIIDSVLVFTEYGGTEVLTVEEAAQELGGN